MQGIPTEAWAKFKPDQPCWHPLVDHCADVGACVEAILTHTGLRRRLATLGSLPDLTDAQVARLAFLGALHDYGKLNHDFQRQIQPGRRHGGHVVPALAPLCSESLTRRTCDVLQWATLATWSDNCQTVLQLLLAALSHHGRPVSEPGGGHDASLWSKDETQDPMADLENLVARARKWFPLAFEATGSAHHLPPMPAFQHAFCGIVSLADWIASDECFFPFTKQGEPDRIAFARERALLALKKIGLAPIEARESRTSLPSFEDIYPFPPCKMQTLVEALPLGSPGSIAILEAETGSGKTEVAFRHFLRHFLAEEVDGLYFALPTRSAATQIHQRIHLAARKAFGEAAPPVVLAVPGYLRVDGVEGVRGLAPFEVLWPDDPADLFRFRGWAAEHPKRYLAASIVVGTIDQVLLSTLQVRHSHIRASALLRHLLVVDEVHASDAYMATLLREVLRHHVASGGHALLMSATLGASVRARLQGIGSEPTIDEAVAVPYPCMSLCEPNGAHAIHPLAPRGGSKHIGIDLRPIGENPGAIAQVAAECVRAGARTLVIRNRVKDALEVQREIEALLPDHPSLFRCQGKVTLHHSRFAAQDRLCLDRAIENQFGKGSPPGPGLVVSTQTIEQSLDVDFDVIITDLCPMDVLLQRFGRVHRHARARPRGFEAPRAIVVTPADRDLRRHIWTAGTHAGRAVGPNGLGTVYPDLRVAEATWQTLEAHEHLEIPTMNRRLVEEAVHPKRLQDVACQLGPPWDAHAQKMDGMALARQGVARLGCVRRDARFDLDPQSQFANIDQEIRTRLGEDDRIVHFGSKPTGPFGNLIAELRISGWLVDHKAEDNEASDVAAVEGGFVFRHGSRSFRYDRFGLWRSDVESP